MKYVVVSAFGKGNWLAAEFSRLGFDTTLLDLSSRFGAWAPEDWEGPFGFYKTQRMSPSQIYRLTEDEITEEINRGFSIWTKRGPIEFKGPLNLYRFNSLEISQNCINYLKSLNTATLEEETHSRAQLMQNSFLSSWPAHFLTALYSNQFLDNSKSLQSGPSAPAFSSFWIRRASRKGLKIGHRLIKSHGVNIIDCNERPDFEIHQGYLKSIAGIEFENVKESKVVFCLSTLEMDYVFNKTIETGLLSNTYEPEWFWSRYRFEFENSDLMKSFPIYFTTIEDIELPWCHENLMIFMRTVNEKAFDIWVRLPSNKRFDKKYLIEMREKIRKSIRNRVANLELEILDMPQEYNYDAASLGPALFPVFSNSDWIQKAESRVKNVSLVGVESQRGLDWRSVFERQVGYVSEQLEKQRHLKGGRIDQSIHAP